MAGKSTRAKTASAEASAPKKRCFSTTDSPTFVVRPGSALYMAQKLEFQRLWEVNRPAAG